MIKIKTILLLLALILCASVQAEKYEPLSIDPQFRVGNLENGLTYYIRHSENPSGHAEFYIVHNVGSLQEEDNQQGLAHFLEHMAFNGTKNFEGKNFLNYFANIGVKFGSNVNAFTSKDRTVYNISSVPTHRTTIIDSTILALHDWSSFISCQSDEVEAERGVVREEWRRSNDVRTRLMKAVWRYEQQGSKFAVRDVLGDINIINTFTRDELLDYYHKWYRPDLQAVIVVGDIDVEYVEAQIKSTFNNIPRAENGAEREIYTIEDHLDPTIGYFVDPEAKAASVRMSVKIPYLDAESSQTQLYIEHEVMHEILMRLIKERYTALGKVESPKLKIAIPATTELSYYGRTVTITAIPLNNDFDAATQALLEEYERIMRYGFSAREVRKAAAAYLMSWEQESRERLTNRKYVDAAVEHYTRHRPLISHDLYCTIVSSIIDNVDETQMNDFVAEVWGDKNRTIVFCGGSAHEEFFSSESDVASYLQQVKESPMEPFVLPETKGPEFRDVESYATIVSHEFNESLQSEHIVMSNGMEMYWHTVEGARFPLEVSYISPMGWESGSIDQLPSLKMFNAISSSATLSSMSRSENEAWLDEQGLRIFSRINNNHSRISLTSKSENGHGLIFKLIDGYINSMGVAPKDFASLKAEMLKRAEQPKGASKIYSDSLNSLKYLDPIAVMPLTREQITAIDREQIEATFHRHFNPNNCGYLLVKSTVPFDKSIEVINSSFDQSLPAKELQVSDLLTPALIYNKQHVDLHYTTPGQAGAKAQVEVTYHIDSAYDAQQSLVLDIFSYILRDRLMSSIREEMGATYNISVEGGLHMAQEPYQKIEVSFDTDPALLANVLEAIDETLAKIASEGITATELENLKLYIAKRDAERNASGMNFIVDMTKYITSGEDLQLNSAEILRAISVEDIEALARRYYNSGNKIESYYCPVVE